MAGMVEVVVAVSVEIYGCSVGKRFLAPQWVLTVESWMCNGGAGSEFASRHADTLRMRQSGCGVHGIAGKFGAAHGQLPPDVVSEDE